MTYAKARLWAGMSGILLWTILIGGSLILLSNSSFFSTQEIPDETWVLILAASHLLFSLPFDFLGGVALPNRHQQYRMIFDGWWKKWARAACFQFGIYLLMGFWLLMLGGLLGPVGTIGGFGLMMLLLGGLQIWVARASVKWESFYDNHKGKLVIYLDNEDPGFTGGISGIPGMEAFVIPNKWRTEMTDKMLTVMKGRRHGAIQTLSHAKGFLAAFLWNLIAFSIAVMVIPGGTATGPGLIQVVGCFSLIQLLGGQLLLSPLSRRAIWEIDRWLYFRGGDADTIRQSFHFTAIKEELLPKDARLLQAFVPMPDPYSRAQHIAEQRKVKGAWQATRQATFLSWAGMNVFSRVLPAVIGRPERWVFLPGD